MIILVALNIVGSLLFAEPDVMPATCDDLLPEVGDYIMFMEQVGHLWIAKEPSQTRKVYDVLAIRRLYQETTRDYNNPVDWQIKRFLCDCYYNNGKQLFRADSGVVRSYTRKHINKLISSATDEYLKLRMRLYDEEKAERMSLAWRDKILRMRSEQVRVMEKKLNSEFDRKLKARQKKSGNKA